jgi:hypothetical protein
MVTSTKRAISPMRQVFERLTPGNRPVGPSKFPL